MITGERIQELCDIYLGLPENFFCNPQIRPQVEKHMNLRTISALWDNPRTIFCYGHCLPLLVEKLLFLKNPFVLVTHNSDEQIVDKYRCIADHPLLLAWSAQNVLFEHPKLHWIPIGIANSMWPHGNLSAFEVTVPTIKSKDIYFYFNVDTNYVERNDCYQKIKHKGLLFASPMPFNEYIKELSSHKYAICPPGNGVDCHRFWECFYLGVIPILKRSYFTEQVAKQFKCVIVDNWADLSIDSLLREYIAPPVYSKLSMSYLKDAIKTHVQIYFNE
jgi:hypothetical protein